MSACSYADFFIAIKRREKTGGIVTLNVISNPDNASRAKYTIARVVYAQSGAASLRLAEAFASIIYNVSHARGCAPIDVATDAATFDVNNAGARGHDDLSVRADDARFQMCLRVVERMLNGNLVDVCCGATRFHRDGELPTWARARGFIAEIDGFLFYA